MIVGTREILSAEPYSLAKEEKSRLLNQRLRELTRLHYEKCEPYRRIMDAMGMDVGHLPCYEELPFLPARIFKELEMRSCAKEEIVKTMTSSGTAGQQVSRIYLDRETSWLQTKCLAKIVSSFIGPKRIPMLIIDSSAAIRDRNVFSARGAGILGFSVFGSERHFALDDEMELDTDGMKRFLEAHKGEPVFLFGFTFMIWQHFYKKLQESGYRPDLSGGILIHGGGWKKLAAGKVSPEDYKKALNSVCGIRLENIHDYYGMVEQTGVICMECERGRLHASCFSDVLIRRPEDFSLAGNGETGLIEVVSVLPQSYPGHILLTEDLGRIIGEDDCPCGRMGKYFSVEGRITNAEIRGCSDTYATNF